MTRPERRRPQGEGWHVIQLTEEWTGWQCGNVFALSCVELVEDEHLPAHWEWLVSFSKMGRERLSNEELKAPLKTFNLEGFEEDNHERGIARKFWMAVDPQYRKPCPCKDEVVITEGDYQWSEKRTLR